MNIGLIVSLILFGIFALAALVGYMKGKKYVWQYSLMRLLLNVIAIVIAIPLTKFIAKISVSALLGMITNSNAGEMEIIMNLSVALDVIRVMIAMFVGIFIFGIVRLVIKFILKFFAPALSSVLIAATESIGKNKGEDNEPVVSELSYDDSMSDEGDVEVEIEPTKSAPKKKKSPKREGCYALKPQLASIMIGIVGCVFGVAVFFAPITGFVAMMDDALELINPEDINELNNEESIANYNDVRGITNGPAIRFSNAIGGKVIFNTLTTYKVNDTKIKLKNEVNLAATIGASAITLSNDQADKQTQKDAVADIIEAFDQSSTLPLILSDVVNQAATAFDNGEDFMGLESPKKQNAEEQDAEQQDAEKQDISERLLTEFIGTFKGCTPESIKQDIKTIGGFVIIVIEHDSLQTLFDNPENLLSENGLLEELLGEFFANDRLSTLASTFVEIGIEMLYDTLGVADNLEKPHRELKEELASIQLRISSPIASVMSDAKSDAENKMLASDPEIKKAVRKAFNACGIDITDASVNEVTEKLKAKENVNAVNEALKDVKINSKDSTEGKKVDLTTLESFEEASLLLTKKDVQITHVTKINDPKNEAKNLAKALSSIAQLTKDIEGEDTSNVSAILSAAGGLLDNLSGTEIIGKETVDKLVVVMFQSDMATEEFSGNVVAVTNAVNSIIESTNSSTDNGTAGGYAGAMENIAGMVDTMTSISESSDNPQALVESLTETLKGMSPETAMATKHLMGNTEFVEKLGVAEENSEGVASLIANLFDNIASAQDKDSEDYLEPSVYEAETESIAELLEITINMSENEEEPAEEEIKQYYEKALKSKILTRTITGTVLTPDGKEVSRLDPLNIKPEYENEAEKQDFINDINEQLATRLADIDADTTIEDKEAAKEDATKLAVAVAAFAGIKTVANGNVIVLD